jgi:hypothetical protein
MDEVGNFPCGDLRLRTGFADVVDLDADSVLDDLGELLFVGCRCVRSIDEACVTVGMQR